MSNTNPPNPQQPIEPEAFLAESSSTASDISGRSSASDEAVDNILPASQAMDQDPAADDFEPQTDWFVLARKLRQHNRELVKTVVQLEQALAESQKRLQNQIVRSRSADTLIAQQSEKLNAHQAQLSNLSQQLQALQSKDSQTVPSTADPDLAKQYQASLERYAQLERECTLLQESHSQQQQQIFEAKQEVQDLQARLQRQQRHTLQFKAALERLQQSSRSVVNEPLESSITPPMIPKTAQIKPWSDQEHTNTQATVDESNEQESTPANISPSAEPVVAEDSPTQSATAADEVSHVQEGNQPEQWASATSVVVDSPAQTAAETTQSRPQQTLFFTIDKDKLSQRQSLVSSPKSAIPKQRTNWPAPTLNLRRNNSNQQKKSLSKAGVKLPSLSQSPEMESPIYL